MDAVCGEHVGGVAEGFGENVFSLRVMRGYLSEWAYEALESTVCGGSSLDPAVADEVAEAMKKWALEKGATHFTHWFQPLTGTTAEKHESFLVPDKEEGALYRFSGKELVKGEPDASSFPSGGLRATFEARGYTAWDPSSPAFIRETEKGGTLCIPTVFLGYHGEALDKKTPLLRSQEALSKQLCRLGKLFGILCEGKRGDTTLGPEQEYFLVDRKFFDRRLDLLQTGRTLFGRTPAKHQQMEDHYFAMIKPRVLAYMYDVDRKLWKLGIPAKTRHNEVCPAQFEIAPEYEELNLSVDHNMLTMEVLRTVAEKHGLVCLLHEKPFAGVNGSGKHNNWSICGPDGKNWLMPGDNPHENEKFLTLICAFMKAIDTHAALLRASVATAGNDHRLGANEAPPAIMSIYLGDQLTDVIEQIEKGGAKVSKQGGILEMGVLRLPRLPRDASDRNRTSPFAFTGNKFEFRAVGSHQSCADPNTILNTIVADALDEICSEAEGAVEKGKDLSDVLAGILKGIIEKHKRIIFNGDNYTEEWQKEAEKRGLPNLRSAPEVLPVLKAEETIAVFEKHGVLSRRELESRYEVYNEAYESTVRIEAECALHMAKTLILPSASACVSDTADGIAAVTSVDKALDLSASKSLLGDLVRLRERLIAATTELERCMETGPAETLSAMADLRDVVDALEGMVPGEQWPLPSYAEMLFML